MTDITGVNIYIPAQPTAGHRFLVSNTMFSDVCKKRLYGISAWQGIGLRFPERQCEHRWPNASTHLACSLQCYAVSSPLHVLIPEKGTPIRCR